MAMDVYNNFSGNGVKVQQFTYHGRDSQQFGFYKQSNDGTYRIVTKSSLGTRNLSVQSASTANGAIIHQYGYGGANDFWWLEKVNFGAAPSYTTIQVGVTNKLNCAGFALRINKFLDGSTLNVKAWDSVETVAGKTMTYFKNTQSGRTIRRISGVNLTPTYSISSNEYRVALRVATTKMSSYDYHFMVQLNTGEWAHKQGGMASEKLGYINPTIYGWSGRYDSDVIYFAVSK